MKTTRNLLAALLTLSLLPVGSGAQQPGAALPIPARPPTNSGPPGGIPGITPPIAPSVPVAPRPPGAGNLTPPPVVPAPPIVVTPEVFPGGSPGAGRPGRASNVVPPGDPFAKTPTAGGGAVIQDATGPINLTAVLETWTVSQADFLALLDDSPGGMLSYARIREYAASKKARLDNVIAVTARSGNRAIAGSQDEVYYPIEFDRPGAVGEIAFPTSFETRNVGDSLEVEMTLEPDGQTCDLNVVPNSTRLLGFREMRAEADATPLPQPEFEDPKLTTTARVKLGETRFIGTMSRPAAEQGPAETTLAFLRIQPDAPAAPAAGKTLEEGDPLRNDLVLISMDRGTAQSLLLENHSSAKIYEATRALLTKNAAQLETTIAVVTRSGNRATAEHTREFRYATGYMRPQWVTVAEAPAPPLRNPAMPKAFETRNVGISLEIEPATGPGGAFIDLNINPKVVRYMGPLKMGASFTRYPDQPLMESREISTSLTVANGAPGFIGTMNLPRETGVNDRKDSGKVVLAFLRSTIVKQ